MIAPDIVTVMLVCYIASRGFTYYIKLSFYMNSNKKGKVTMQPALKSFLTAKRNSGTMSLSFGESE